MGHCGTDSPDGKLVRKRIPSVDIPDGIIGSSHEQCDSVFGPILISSNMSSSLWPRFSEKPTSSEMRIFGQISDWPGICRHVGWPLTSQQCRSDRISIYDPDDAIARWGIDLGDCD
jgi:hypothetical protein